ncbi:MAG: conjugal transfer protein TraD [Chlamydiales bacterium]|nr:conjugal transfer protein TraD [Chlamydiales bacterium]MBY0529930.1 conjugal transfer protein TraD [Rhabdochlamydiaceae bacterium]
MHIEKLMKQKEKISQKKEHLGKKELLLKMKERKIRTRRLILSGELIVKAGIDHLPPIVLLGALLEIKDRAHDEIAIKAWQTKAEVMFEHDQHVNAQPLILSFEVELDESSKASLKALKFRWNAFRREWYGFGKKDELEALFKGFGAKIETTSIQNR